MLPLTVVAKLDAWQRRHAAAAVPVAVAKKFHEDSASSLAALIAYYAFFSLFPLLLVFVSVLGFVLQATRRFGTTSCTPRSPRSRSSAPSLATSSIR